MEVSGVSTNNQKGPTGQHDNEKDREEYGYGYDKSVDDLKVIGQNQSAKKNNRNK